MHAVSACHTVRAGQRALEARRDFGLIQTLQRAVGGRGVGV
jgi:hypothetical protein